MQIGQKVEILHKGYPFNVLSDEKYGEIIRIIITLDGPLYTVRLKDGNLMWADEIEIRPIE